LNFSINFKALSTRLKLFELHKCLHAILLWLQLLYDEYINYLSKISKICDEIDSPNVLIVGDFNACPTNNFGVLLSQFCLEHELKISDKINLPADSFTYGIDAHGTCSWLDHLVSSKLYSKHWNITPIHSLWPQASSCNHKNSSNTPKPTLW